MHNDDLPTDVRVIPLLADRGIRPTRSLLMACTRALRDGYSLPPATMNYLTASCDSILNDPRSFDRLRRRASECLAEIAHHRERSTPGTHREGVR